MSIGGCWLGDGITGDNPIHGGARVGWRYTGTFGRLGNLSYRATTLSSRLDTPILLYSVSVQLTVGGDDNRNNL
jgi:hypothetical protein